MSSRVMNFELPVTTSRRRSNPARIDDLLTAFSVTDTVESVCAAWLIATAMGETQFALVGAVFAHPIGKLVLFGYTWALAHHMLGGMRHLLWDTGRGLQIWQVNLLSWLTIVGSVALTLAIWAVVLLEGGL